MTPHLSFCNTNVVNLPLVIVSSVVSLHLNHVKYHFHHHKKA